MVIIWVMVITISFSWNYYIIRSGTLELVMNKAHSFFSQIVVTRAWNSSHGGIYVPVTVKTQPNPYLSDSLRDVVTIDGLKLTKINPAFMTRQIAEINNVENELRFHITSLNPIRPGNIADQWENKVLKGFERNKDEILELVQNDSVSEYRYMAPLITAKSCLKCHAVQGYEEGDIRGGISISFPSALYTNSQESQTFYLLTAHLLILILGLAGLAKYYKTTSHYFSVIKIKNDELETERNLLRQANLDLSRLVAEKDKFFSILAHDLRNPFNGFLGLTEVMADDLPDMTRDEIHGMALSLKKSAINVFGLLENLLDWSRMEQGLIPFNPAEIQILPIIEESIVPAMEVAKNKEIGITYDIPSDLVVFADPNFIQAIVRNLVMNAVKFTPRGGLVTISAKPTAHRFIEIAIQDSGIGMSEDMVDNLFHFDGQTNRKGTAGEPSSGLGLLICKDFIEKHHGKMSVESKEGLGSTFYFTLPIGNEHEKSDH